MVNDGLDVTLVHELNSLFQRVEADYLHLTGLFARGFQRTDLGRTVVGIDTIETIQVWVGRQNGFGVGIRDLGILLVNIFHHDLDLGVGNGILETLDALFRVQRGQRTNLNGHLALTTQKFGHGLTGQETGMVVIGTNVDQAAASRRIRVESNDRDVLL